MRLALGISYNGQGYEGWQSQRSGRTVQDRLEAALARVVVDNLAGAGINEVLPRPELVGQALSRAQALSARLQRSDRLCGHP